MLSRLTEPITSAFAGTARPAPSPADVQRCVARMHEEIKAAAGSARLATLNAAMVGKALLVLAERAEHMSASGPDLRAMGGAANPSQARNIALANALAEVTRSVAALAPRLPPAALDTLRGPLDLVQGAALEMVAPTFKAMVEAAESAVLRLHSTDLGGGSGGEAAAGVGPGGEGVVNTSPYMKGLVKHIAHCRWDIVLGQCARGSCAPSC